MATVLGFSSKNWNGTSRLRLQYSTTRCPLLLDVPTTMTVSPFISVTSQFPSSENWNIVHNINKISVSTYCVWLLNYYECTIKRKQLLIVWQCTLYILKHNTLSFPVWVVFKSNKTLTLVLCTFCGV